MTKKPGIFTRGKSYVLEAKFACVINRTPLESAAFVQTTMRGFMTESDLKFAASFPRFRTLNRLYRSTELLLAILATFFLNSRHVHGSEYYEHCSAEWWQCNSAYWDHVVITLRFTVTTPFTQGGPYQIGTVGNVGGFQFSGPLAVGDVLVYQIGPPTGIDPTNSPTWTYAPNAVNIAGTASQVGYCRGIYESWTAHKVSPSAGGTVIEVTAYGEIGLGDAPALPAPAVVLNTKCNDHKLGGDQSNCQSCGASGSAPAVGMPRYSVHSRLVSLNVQDTPLRYSPPYGPAVDLTLTYNQRDNQQPSTFSYSNLGPKWTFGWMSYVIDNPTSQLPSTSVYRSGGGTEVFNYDQVSKTFSVDPQSHAQLVKLVDSNGVITYERRMPDGSKEVFTKADAATSYPRRIFMTKIIDPQGNTLNIQYDSSFRVMRIYDAQNNPTDANAIYTELSYELLGDPYKITKVTDPYGRAAQFGYTDGQLTSIADEAGISSQIQYKFGTDFIEKLTTPYGPTQFVSGESGTARWIEIEDPRGGKERVEYRDDTPGMSDNEAVAPSGFTNTGLKAANTFFWSKRANEMYPPTNGVVYDYGKAAVTHWLYNSDNSVSAIVSSEKKPLENRVWYSYENQPDGSHIGSSASPTKIARILDDATTQLTQYTYNVVGNVTKEIDPRGRVTTYSFDSSGIDLLAVYQRNAGGQSTDAENQAADRILENIYDLANEPAHKPAIVKDAARQPTTYHYNTNGQTLWVKNAKNEQTDYSYGDGTDATVPKGYLGSITGPTFNNARPKTTYTYDLVNRIYTTTTSPDNYTVTTVRDPLDRPVSVTYPDTSTEEFEYTQDFQDGRGVQKILEVSRSKDRDGRWTSRHYNRNGQVESVTDPANQQTSYDWCTCGALVGITDPEQNLTSFGLDLQSRVTSKTFSATDTTPAKTISYIYENTTSRLHSTTDALNQIATYAYFADDTTLTVTYTNAQHQTPKLTYGYDLRYKRVTSATTQGVGTTIYSYYPVTTSGTLGANQVYQIDGPFAADVITYSYDQLGRRDSQDINGAIANIGYDSLGRLDTNTNVLGSFSRVYESDVTQRLKTLQYPNGQTANYTYFDNTYDRRLQKLQHLTGGLANLSRHDYTYDSEGQIQSWTKTFSTDAAIPFSFSYDDARRLTASSQSFGHGARSSMYFGYDYAGNRTGRWLASSSLFAEPNGAYETYTPNSLNQLTSVTKHDVNNQAVTSEMHYDFNGNMIADDATQQTYEWDAANRLTAINYTVSGARTEFTYDGLGHRIRITEIAAGTTANIQPQSSAYTAFNTTPFTLPAGTYVLSFEGTAREGRGFNPNLPYRGIPIGLVDSVALNNLLVPNGSFEGPDESAQPNDALEFNPASSMWSFTSDSGIAAAGSSVVQNNPSAPSGNQVAFIMSRGSISQVWTAAAGTYTLSFMAAQSGSTDVSQSLRVSLRPAVNAVTVKNFVWCGNQICEERDANNSVTKRFFAEGEQRVGGSDAGNYYYSRDHLGSIREVTDASGNLKARYDYDPFGNEVVLTGNMNVDFGFTGHYFHQSSSLNLTMYRAYNANIGRWISRDPIGEKGGLNLYGYVENDSIRKIDLLGKQAQLAIPIGIGIEEIITGGAITHFVINLIKSSCDNEEKRQCRQRCNEDWFANEKVCNQLPEPFRTKCLRDIQKDLQYCLRRCNGSWY